MPRCKRGRSGSGMWFGLLFWRWQTPLFLVEQCGLAGIRPTPLFETAQVRTLSVSLALYIDPQAGHEAAPQRCQGKVRTSSFWITAIICSTVCRRLRASAAPPLPSLPVSAPPSACADRMQVSRNHVSMRARGRMVTAEKTDVVFKQLLVCVFLGG